MRVFCLILFFTPAAHGAKVAETRNAFQRAADFAHHVRFRLRLAIPGNTRAYNEALHARIVDGMNQAGLRAGIDAVPAHVRQKAKYLFLTKDIGDFGHVALDTLNAPSEKFRRLIEQDRTLELLDNNPYTEYLVRNHDLVPPRVLGGIEGALREAYREFGRPSTSGDTLLDRALSEYNRNLKPIQEAMENAILVALGIDRRATHEEPSIFNLYEGKKRSLSDSEIDRRNEELHLETPARVAAWIEESPLRQRLAWKVQDLSKIGYKEIRRPEVARWFALLVFEAEGRVHRLTAESSDGYASESQVKSRLVTLIHARPFPRERADVLALRAYGLSELETKQILDGLPPPLASIVLKEPSVLIDLFKMDSRFIQCLQAHGVFSHHVTLYKLESILEWATKRYLARSRKAVQDDDNSRQFLNDIFDRTKALRSEIDWLQFETFFKRVLLGSKGSWSDLASVIKKDPEYGTFSNQILGRGFDPSWYPENALSGSGLSAELKLRLVSGYLEALRVHRAHVRQGLPSLQPAIDEYSKVVDFVKQALEDQKAFKQLKEGAIKQ